jgi:hypothetical protein
MSSPEAARCPRCDRPTSTPNTLCALCRQAESPPLAEGEGPELPSIRAGEVFEGKWRIESKLGAGGMGTVFLAHDLALDRKVAVKVLARELSADAEFVARFEREARLTARLEHPNVVPVYSVGRHGVRPFMVMKKLEGMTLAQLIERRQASGSRLARAEILAVFSQVSAGLSHLHAQGCVHRDLKAANIFVGPDGHATILDFGVLRDAGQTGLTRLGAVLGTPHYMSPEQARGSSAIDHRADVYALGVVLFECLTGTPPFMGETELAVVHQHAYAAPPDVSQWRPDLPPSLAKTLDRALAKLPDDRFQSADELFRALQASWRGQGSGARDALRAPPPQAGAILAPDNPAAPAHVEPSAGEEAPFPPPEGWSAPAAPAAVASRMASAALLAGSPGQQDPAAAPARRSRTLAVALGMAAGALLSAALVGGYFALRQPPPSPRPAPPARAEPPARAVPTPAPRPPRGTLRVTSILSGRPYTATVKVDGVSRGSTPLTLSLPPGRYAVRVERQGFQPFDQTVTVTAQRSTALEADLLP